MSIFAFSDLHAQYNLWEQIKNYIKPEDIAYCLGDCVDRGPVGLEILNEIIEMPNITLLRGNHEDFIDSIGTKLINYNPDQFDDEDLFYSFPTLYLWYSNGAENTIDAFKKLSKGKKQWLINKIKKLPTHAEYINTKGDIIYLCHAGRQPDTEEIKDMYMGDIPMNNYIWDRNHIKEQHWRGKDNEYCVHGHTPVEYMKYYLKSYSTDLPKSKYKMYKYCNNHKINIDLGSFDTHCTCLLNLDTFEPIYFKDKTIFEKEQEKKNG